MLWITRFSAFFSAAMAVIVLSPSLHRKALENGYSVSPIYVFLQYCHANFTKYFTGGFWAEERFSGTFRRRRRACYFNTGVMVIDLKKWRRGAYTRRIEKWMEIQRTERIYELGSLPPFLLVFAGHVAPILHRWNQHGLGGDNVRGSCRDLHPGPVSLLHWSGSGKPWLRLDSKRPCPLDALWTPYDLYRHSH
ncbi:hypothetical protein Bca101_003324 [Brassica carinata]